MAVKSVLSKATSTSPAKASPAELPCGVFYAVVIYDSRIKHVVAFKALSRNRNDFTSYIKSVSETNDGWVPSDTPTLFDTLAEATTLKSMVASHYEDDGATQVFIQTFRLIESLWEPGYDTRKSRINDAIHSAESLLTYDAIATQVKKLAGRVLTILDASYINENQNKAVKDLVKTAFRGQLSDLYNAAYEDPNCQGAEGTCSKDILDD